MPSQVLWRHASNTLQARWQLDIWVKLFETRKTIQSSQAKTVHELNICVFFNACDILCVKVLFALKYFIVIEKWYSILSSFRYMLTYLKYGEIMFVAWNMEKSKSVQITYEVKHKLEATHLQFNCISCFQGFTKYQNLFNILCSIRQHWTPHLT